MWQRTGAHMTYLGRMDGSEPGLTSATQGIGLPSLHLSEPM